jgi:chromosome segregation ATPase
MGLGKMGNWFSVGKEVTDIKASFNALELNFKETLKSWRDEFGKITAQIAALQARTTNLEDRQIETIRRIKELEDYTNGLEQKIIGLQSRLDSLNSKQNIKSKATGKKPIKKNPRNKPNRK